MYWRGLNYFGAHRVRQRPVYLSMAVVAFAGGLQEVRNRWWRWRRTHKRSAHRWCSKALRQHSSFFLTDLGFGGIAVAVYKSSTQIHLFRDAQRAPNDVPVSVVRGVVVTQYSPWQSITFPCESFRHNISHALGSSWKIFTSPEDPRCCESHWGCYVW